MHVSQMRVRLGVAAVAATLLAGCGGGSDDSPADTTKASSSAPAATSDAPAEPSTSGTFRVSGSLEGQGNLSEVVCVPVEGGIQVTAKFAASGKTGSLSVISGPAPSDHERGDSFTVKGDKILMFTRISADTLPYDIKDDGSKVTGSVTLAEMGDIAKPDVNDRKQVKLTVDIDCGT
ncbi:hypothetical protein [Aeromicrobium ginsengisoli]|uniref:Lipoprotein LpqH n=1 Tax=Aeromicrobium ginsengisoli TaxID=363867 RepID=A0A5M4FB02_9ACTN|nr:hypothetical protein [Aeromicrobium ginsengisoli]KAA1395447.1 hypothetical protein ESP70_014920 [Aeromicrobium ginsengisoli]